MYHQRANIFVDIIKNQDTISHHSGQVEQTFQYEMNAVKTEGDSHGQCAAISVILMRKNLTEIDFMVKS